MQLSTRYGIIWKERGCIPVQNFLELESLPVIWNGVPKMNYRIFAKNESHIDRIPSFSTLLIVLKGTLSFLEDGERVDIKAGEYYIQKEGTLQKGVPIIDPPMYFYIHFCGTFVSSPTKRSIAIRGKVDVEDIRQICNIAIMGGKNALSKFDAQYYFYRILKKIENYNSPKRGGDLAAKVQEFIENNAANIDNLDDICHKLNYSKDYVIRAFKKRFNITPYQYIKYCKINFAKELLRTTNLTISQIAENCGYSDETVFYRTFKSVSGKSPAVWRDETKEDSD